VGIPDLLEQIRHCHALSPGKAFFGNRDHRCYIRYFSSCGTLSRYKCSYGLLIEMPKMI
jgi:hypothetical protein